MSTSFPWLHPTLLAGTPLQNELSEYYALVSFASPGLLGAEPFFAREFAKPIKARCILYGMEAATVWDAT